MTVDVDNNSGFCAGVIRAIDKAEEYLDKADVSRKRLYSLGAIVYNESELNRLASKGLVTIGREDLSETRAAEGETSIYADLRDGRRTEVDTISGAVLDAAKRHGLAAPCTEFVVGLVHALEDKAQA